ncbi:MAG: metallophosphoesterase [Candidatus Spyradocola sp.]
MRIYAIGDLHLPGAQSKPMDVFGAHWEGHFEKIEQDWRSRVQPEDLVLVPGDLSWAMTLEEATPDLQRICALPGRKLLLRGNHDYWWSSLTRVRALLPEGNWALQNDARVIGDAVFCGTRGWNVISETSTDAQNLKIYRREVMRLELSLKDAAAKAQGHPIVCMLHFPPFGEKREASGFTELLESYGVHTCVYGHLHGEGIRAAFEGERGGVNYKLVSCDSLGFRLHEVELA